MRGHLIVTGALAALAAADETWTVDAKSNWGEWEGWGVSLAWWAKAFGTRSDLAYLFFTDSFTTFGSSKLPGLNFNIVRYNAGACSNNTFSGATMVAAPTVKPSRQMDGFWWDWASDDPKSASWHWDVDDSQRRMLDKAIENGANRVELFSNSPMWWQLANKNPSGSDDGTSDNLQSWNYGAHTHYLAEIARYAKDNWGVTFTSVSPFNEPSSTWWSGATGAQEGCHFDRTTMAAVIPMMRSALDAKGLSTTIVAASDEFNIAAAIETFRALGEAARDVGRINVHGYGGLEGDRTGLFDLAAGATVGLWTSEYGDDDATGQELVSNLIQDFRWLHPTAWAYWQAVDGAGWGLIDGNNDDGTLGGAEQKYFCLAQFSRHIREGMRILDGGADNVVAAYDEANSRLVVVVVNWGDAQVLNFDLAGFSAPGKDGQVVQRWSTQIGSGNQYRSFVDTVQAGTKFGARFEHLEIQTFEIPNVDI